MFGSFPEIVYLCIVIEKEQSVTGRDDTLKYNLRHRRFIFVNKSFGMFRIVNGEL